MYIVLYMRINLKYLLSERSNLVKQNMIRLYISSKVNLIYLPNKQINCLTTYEKGNNKPNWCNVLRENLSTQ